MILNIKSVEDIEIVRQAILNNEDFELGDISPLPYKIKLDGGRFEDYDTEYIIADVARIIISHQESYTKLLNELEKKYGILFTDEEKILKFKLQDGCLEFISDLLGLEAIKKMKSKHILYMILGVSAMWFANDSYHEHVSTELKELEVRFDAEKDKAITETLSEAIAGMKEIAQSKTFQNAINSPKYTAVSVLKDNEKLLLENKVLTSLDKTNYEYVKPIVDDIEEEAIFKKYTVETYNFHKEGKLFKLLGVPIMANSEVITTSQRMILIGRAEKREEVNIKVKITRDGVNKKIKSIYIIDIEE